MENAKWDQMLRDGLRPRVLSRPSHVVSTLGSLASIGGLYWAVHASPPDADLIRVFYVMVVFISFLIGTAIFQEVRYARKARYAEAMALIHTACHIGRDACFDPGKIAELEDLRGVLVRILNAAATAGSVVTATTCRAKVKTVRIHQDQRALIATGTDADFALKTESHGIHIEDFVEDDMSRGRERCRPDPPYDWNWMAGNTDLKTLALGEDNVFVCNDVVRDLKRNDVQSTEPHFYADRRLPYRSFITVPIRRRLSGNSKQAPVPGISSEYDFMGFLRLESSARGAWERRYDPQMFAAIADVIYTLMARWHEAHRTGSHGHGSGTGNPAEPAESPVE